jgi:hypothetical protein
MGLQFTEDAWQQARLLTSPILAAAPAYPLTASIHLTDIDFDELLIAVLLQACLGGSANMYRVQQITSYCYMFFVPSIASMNLILAQKPIRARRFTLIFDHICLAPPSTTTTFYAGIHATTTTSAVPALLPSATALHCSDATNSLTAIQAPEDEEGNCYRHAKNDISAGLRCRLTNAAS